MKRIVSVSLGSSKRNHTASTMVLGEEIVVERIGTDGSIDNAIKMIKELDGQVDAFGMGGIDLYVYAGKNRYAFRDAKRIAAAATKSPIVDGSGLKNTLERRVVSWVDENILPLKGKKVLMVSSVDRFGMAESLWAKGAEILFGDLIFGLGVNLPIRKLKTVHWIAGLLLPIITQLPFTWLYPTGEKQEKREQKYGEHYAWADVIAGDWLYIGRYLPNDLTGKLILTNTVTPKDIEDLRARGATTLVTTTPNLGGRSFGTNLMEGLIVAAAGKKASEMTPADYEAWLDKIGFAPRVEVLQEAALERKGAL
ncbi:MAG TPA: quinate 5-dehydrogenase [Symbiobacteriaceae bacterium]|nr:quinate 5-dehydrogenase [Symbiobacteriaceae bacterium]